MLIQTRAALLTGLYSANTGLTIAAMPGSIVGLPIHLPTMPQLLRKRGYDCHMVGKWHLGITYHAYIELILIIFFVHSL